MEMGKTYNAKKAEFNGSALVDKYTVQSSVIEALLIGVEGAQTPAGSAGQMRPRRRQRRRGGSAPAPRKAKRLERKSTTPFMNQTKYKTVDKLAFIEIVYSLG